MKSKVKDQLQSYLMFLPNLVLFLVIGVYPVIWAMRYMFFEFDGTNPEKYVGLANFVRAFTRDANYWQSVLNTLKYAAGKMILVLPLAFLVAILINSRKKIYGFVQAVIFSPTIMSSAVMSLVFFLLLNVYNGEINQMLLSIGLIKQPINWLGAKYAMLSVIIVAVWGGLGNYMVYFLAGLQQIPLEIYDSSKIDGASAWTEMWTITVPMLGPVLKTILMLAIISAFHDYQSIMVLTEGGPFNKTNVMFLYVYQYYFPSQNAMLGGFRPQYGYGAALSIISAGIVGLVTVIYLKISKKLDDIY